MVDVTSQSVGLLISALSYNLTFNVANISLKTAWVSAFSLVLGELSLTVNVRLRELFSFNFIV